MAKSFNSQNSQNAPIDPALAHLRIPPHSMEAEQSVLGGLLLDNAAFDKIADLVGEGDFYRDEHKRIYRQISKLLERNKPVHVVTVAESLDLAGEGNETGGLAYLGELAANTPSAANIRRYAEIVRERAILRQLVTAGDEIAGSAFNPLGRDPKQLLDEAEAKVFAIAEGGSRHQSGFVHINPLLTQVVVAIPFLFTGSLLLESFFGIPGLGAMTVDAIQGNDFSVLRTMVYIGSLLFVVGQVLTDLSYGLVDPRVRFE